MKRIIFLFCLLAGLYCLGCGIYSLCAIEDVAGKLYLGTLCLLAAAFYGWFAYDKRPWANPWA